MVYSLENDVRGAIFCDPSFVKNFLSVEKAHWPLLDNKLKRLPKIQSMLDDSIIPEQYLYGPILNVLQSVKSAVDTVRATHNLGVLGTNLCDCHGASIPGDPSTHLLKPDLVLFEGHNSGRRSWETLMMPIEVKAKHTYLKVGMKQLAKYACEVFAHQIHRRHLYGMVICKWEATFVRFDRSGIVHSEPIDILKNFKEFRKAFAGLMMLDRHAFGYDTAFTVEYTPEGQLEYYVDLPATAFDSDDTEPGTELVAGPDADPAQQLSPPRQLPSRRFKVMDRLCHRRGIRSRGTIVLRLREVQKHIGQPESGKTPAGRMTRSRTRLQQSQRSEPKWEDIPGRRDYVLKLMWRESDKRQEGEMLKRLNGEYGVVQCQWYSDVLQWGTSCHEPGATFCDECCDMTPCHEVRRVRNLGDLDVVVAEEEGGEGPQYVEVDTGTYVGELHKRRLGTVRVYSWTLFSTVGRPLRTAESSRQFLEAVLDAVLGYWQVLNRGIMHRDISDGNVLIADPDRGYDVRNWKLEQDSMVQDGQYATEAQNHPLAESRRLVQATVMKIGRDPSGFLSDFDLAATRTEMESEASGDAPAKRRHSYSRASNIKDVPDAGPPAKRLRRGDKASFLLSASGPGNVQAWQLGRYNLSPVVVSRQKTYKSIDYRTGTPPFMSIRVLEVKPGTPYEHHFMDDLQSFFWLILWCVIAHIDPSSDENGNGNPRTEEASTLLHKLDRPDSDFSTMADSKRSLLIDCINGGDGFPCTMVEKLACCGNSWANNPAIVDVIVNLGVYFRTITATRDRFLKCTPATEFPKFVGMIAEGLESL